MYEPFIGAIIIFGGNFAIKGYALCNGQMLSIANNTALFSILGTTYGGDGRVTFGLPDLRGRTIVGWGAGPGLPANNLGEMGGSPTATLTIANLPSHNHATNLPVSSGSASTDEAAGNILAATSANTYAAANTANGSYGTNTVTAVSGGNQPFSIETPYLVLNYQIALQGIFPSRN